MVLKNITILNQTKKAINERLLLVCMITALEIRKGNDCDREFIKEQEFNKMLNAKVNLSKVAQC